MLQQGGYEFLMQNCLYQCFDWKLYLILGQTSLEIRFLSLDSLAGLIPLIPSQACKYHINAYNVEAVIDSFSAGFTRFISQQI